MKRTDHNSEMTRSWLVQRLRKPEQNTWLGMKDNPFAFGGGLVNGGLSGEAMDLLRGVFAFDYMGAAEFEFGAVPQALNGIAKDAHKLAASILTIPLRDVQPHWRDRKNTTQPEGDATIYVLAREADIPEVENRIRGWAAGPNDLKEWTNLSSALRPVDDFDTRTVGWFELDNGFFFFTDEQMWAGTADLFGVRAPVSS